MPEASIVTGAYGALDERCTETNETCWQQERRVEIIVVPGLSGRIGGASPRLDYPK